MRSPKLTSACAAALLTLAVPAAAAAHAHHHGAPRHGAKPGQCHVTLNVAPRFVTSGETALAYGHGACPAPGGESGQTITVFQHSAGTPGFSVAGTATTDAHGLYQVTTPALSRNSVFYATLSGAQSPHRSVKVAAQVTLVGPTEGKELFAAIKTGVRNAVTFTGSVDPNDAGATVVLQRQNDVRGRGWHSIGTTIVNGVGGFAITHVFRFPGASEIRVLVRGNPRNADSASNSLSYDISQAQNPSLTILSSLDPIPYQGTVVISGTAAGAPHAGMTLLARTAGNGYKPVATTTTDGEGKYAFPPQLGLASTFYRVQGAGRSSAVLYEGVKYVLSDTTPSATSVQSGQVFSVSGKVAPASAGHEIWLQRQNNSGTGYHVVGVGQVAADGSYAISHIFYAPGTDVLRVKIPGDPANGGTATPVFGLTVTPVPTAKLKPEPQGNSNQPPVGQV
jgi:hypothetical protein